MASMRLSSRGTNGLMPSLLNIKIFPLFHCSPRRENHAWVVCVARSFLVLFKPPLILKQILITPVTALKSLILLLSFFFLFLTASHSLREGERGISKSCGCMCGERRKVCKEWENASGK